MKITISRMILVSAALFLILCAIPIYYSYLGMSAKVDTQGKNDFKKHIISTASDIASYINYFQLHTDDLAKNKDIKMLANFWGEAEIQEWTIRTRKVLPNTIGLAIFDHNAKIIGDANQQKMGKACLQDVDKFIHAKLLPLPRVHKNNPELRHFDLYSEIKTDDGSFLLLHTIHLGFVESLLGRHDLNNEYYLISNSSGELILEQGEVNNGFSFETAIPGTDWHLKGTATLSDLLSIKQFADKVVIQVLVILITITLLISYVIFRLLHHDKQVLINLMTNMGDKQTLEDLKRPILHDFHVLADQIGKKNDRLNNAIADIEKMALEDSLTQTGNRRLFEKEKAMHMSHGIRGMSICVVTLDLDNFKQVNDTHGHAVGDRMLFSFGKALKSILRDSDSVYRIGGDEFIVILYSMDLDNMQHWYDRLVTQFNAERARYRIKLDVHVGISAGASVFHPDDVSLYQTILRADKALYKSKESGRGQITVSE